MSLATSHEVSAVQGTPAIPAGNPPGLRGAFRLVLEHLGDHLDLMRLETGQELSRLGAVLGCWFALALLVQLVLIFGLTILIATLWNTEYRTLAMICSAGVLLLGIGFCALQMNRLGKQATQRFSATGQQWKRDLDLIREMI